MDLKELLRNIDLYLLDQFLKGRIHRNSRILDAGCGVGRNSHYFLDNDYDIRGFDPLEESVKQIHLDYPEKQGFYSVNSIENYAPNTKFDFVICNAVLHFADSHQQFHQMMDGLSSFLTDKGILFIRMTSEFANPYFYEVNENGRSTLPDGTERYLLSKIELTAAMNRNQLYFLEPLKTINVNDERSMSTLVLTKDNEVKLDIGWLSPDQNPMMK